MVHIDISQCRNAVLARPLDERGQPDPMTNRGKTAVAMQPNDAGRQRFEARFRPAIGLAAAQRLDMPSQPKEPMRSADIPLGLDHVVGDRTGILAVAAIVAQHPKSQIAGL